MLLPSPFPPLAQMRRKKQNKKKASSRERAIFPTARFAFFLPLPTWRLFARDFAFFARQPCTFLRRSHPRRATARNAPAQHAPSSSLSLSPSFSLSLSLVPFRLSVHPARMTLALHATARCALLHRHRQRSSSSSSSSSSPRTTQLLGRSSQQQTQKRKRRMGGLLRFGALGSVVGSKNLPRPGATTGSDGVTRTTSSSQHRGGSSSSPIVTRALSDDEVEGVVVISRGMQKQNPQPPPPRPFETSYDTADGEFAVAATTQVDVEPVASSSSSLQPPNVDDDDEAGKKRCQAPPNSGTVMGAVALITGSTVGAGILAGEGGGR